MSVHPFIEAEKQAGHSVKRACELLKVSRADGVPLRGVADQSWGVRPGRVSTGIALPAQQG
ncbi:hypothetical protein, partial [Streptomyces sp. NPDC127105]|uniref:hypothetical protein n=1 Tax=Streptomyces sp. NPDC127105 TaxID=3345359 RepID=UPI00365350FB